MQAETKDIPALHSLGADLIGDVYYPPLDQSIEIAGKVIQDHPQLLQKIIDSQTGEAIGYFYLYPLSKDVVHALQEGHLQESDIAASDISAQADFLHIADIVVLKTIGGWARSVIATKLLCPLARLFSDRFDRKVSAFPVTPEGVHFSRNRLGLIPTAGSMDMNAENNVATFTSNWCFNDIRFASRAQNLNYL